MKTNTPQKMILVIGMGLSGRSAAQFLCEKGAKVLGVDRNPQTLSQLPELQELQKKGLQLQHEQDPVDFNVIESVILSPGIPSTHPLVQKALQQNIEVMGEIELGCRHLKQSILGITGTNGKTTVTLLVAHVLNHCGFTAKALGNVGKPFTQEISHLSPEEIVVLELSSFQLETLHQMVFDAALLLNITPDHLDRYQDMQAYAAAKCHLQACLKNGSPFIIENNTLQTYGKLLTKANVLAYGYEPDLPVYTDLKSIYHNQKKAFDLPSEFCGRRSHDVENIMGAYALCASKGVSGSQFKEALQAFRKPAHRIEFVLEHKGVHYYDDSKGTNIDAVIRAVQSLKGPIILIAGGVDKNAPYVPWLKEFGGKVKQIFAIGQAAAKMQSELGTEIPVEILKDLEQAVIRAAAIAKKGDFVLLSPGCSSYDMFKDYAHRGEVFQQAVQSLVSGDK